MADLFAMKTPSGQLDPKKLKYPVLVQEKLDGLRGVCRVTPGPVRTWFSFTGKPLWNLENVSTGVPETPGVYDGEIIWPGHPFGDAYGLCKRQNTKGDGATATQSKELEFHCFDYLTLSEWADKSCARPFINRLSTLWAMKYARPFFPMGALAVKNEDELREVYSGYLDDGFEGLMAKQPNGLYYWKRHADWQRFKPTETADVRVLDIYEEEDKHGVRKGTLGGVVVDCGNKVKCKVGGGFKAAERKAWWPNRDLVGQVIEVEFKCWTRDGKMREPHFKRLREDKS